MVSALYISADRNFLSAYSVPFLCNGFQLSSVALRKVSKELQSLQTCPPEGIRIQVDEANLSSLTGWIGVQLSLFYSGWSILLE